MIRQINLSVFSDSMHLIMNSKTYSQSRDYIYSGDYDDDIETVKQVLNTKKGEKIGLGDFRKIVYQDLRGNKGKPIDEETKKRLRESYEKIRFFCMRMEFLGVVSEEKAADSLIIDYYGYTITTTYERLKPLIEKTRKEPNSNELYIHYTQLYNLAKESKKQINKSNN